jgi:cytochrome c-type biogenesis protein CcmH/NrfG
MTLGILGRIAGLDAPLSPADGFDTCGRALIVARVAALGIACFASGTGSRAEGRRRIEAAALAAAFAASLVVRAAFLPFLVVAVVASARTAVTWGAWAAVIALVVTGAAASPRAIEPDALLSPQEHNPATELLRWVVNDNPYRARFWAAQWASRERIPGPGHLALARAYRVLGREVEARGVAERVVAAGDAGAREEATALLHAWAIEDEPGGS